MNISGPDRHLAAILASDVRGSSRLMEAAGERNVSALKRHRAEFFDPVVGSPVRHIFNVTGDGVLVEFASVLSAARCALDLQRGMPERNDGLPKDRQIRFRIGINPGDPIVEGDDVSGDGVNIAARIEALAPPGGISRSAAVRAQVGNRLDVAFLDQGEKTVRNIAQPVDVSFIDVADPAAARGAAARRKDKPSIAVPPFANMSNDPEQEFFSDGITEDFFTDLSKVSGLFGISRNKVFAMRGKALDLPQIARQPGVSYLVQGSFRKAGNRVRVTARLIEGATDGHLWAERHDHDLTDIFAVQDEITQTIVAQLKVKLLPEDKAIEQAPTANVEAYTSYLRAGHSFYHGTRSGITLASQLFARAAELDLTCAMAFAGMANCASDLLSTHAGETPVADLLRLADQALASQLDLPEAHAARGYALSQDGNRDDAAVAAFGRALQTGPNCFEAHDYDARFLAARGVFDRAANHSGRAMELMPDADQIPLIGKMVLEPSGRRDETMAYARLGAKRAEAWLQPHPEESKPWQLSALALALLGESDRARVWLARAMAIDPDDNLLHDYAACTYAQPGKPDRSIDLLEVHMKLVSKDRQKWFLNDFVPDPIRGHPRHRDLPALIQ